MRDPRRLGAERVRVQIALGDLSDHLSFRHALRGVDTVVHLASVIRDQPGGLDRGAGRASPPGGWCRRPSAPGVERFVFFSALGASTRSRARLMRAKAVAERALVRVLARPHGVRALDRLLAERPLHDACCERMSLLPVMPIPGSGQAAFQPIWAEDVADCVIAALPGGALAAEADGARYELAGPETLTYRDIVETRAALVSPQPADRPGSRRRSFAARSSCSSCCTGPPLRHLGRGRAAGDLDDLAPRDRRRRAPRGGRRKSMRAVLGVG